MSFDIAGIRSFESLNAPADPSRGSEEELGKTAFLELMIAQISNQDPLEPAKNEAFIAQLAQFSSVEGIQNLNESMDSLVGSLRSSMAVDAAGLVGRNVLINTDQTALNTAGGIGGSIQLTEPVSDLVLEIQNQQGQVIHQLEFGERPVGEQRFSWDGLDSNGEQVPQDYYNVVAYGEAGGVQQQMAVSLPDQILSVSIDANGLIANLAGGKSVPAAQIREIQ